MKKLDAYDIVQILKDDKFPVNKMFNNAKIQFVQFLMQSLKNKNVLIIGRVVKNKLQNFSVTVNNDGVTSMLYMSDDILNDSEYKKEIFDWAEKFEQSGKISNMKTWDGF